MADDDTRRKSRIGPRAFLKRNGFALDKKPHQIDHMLLRVLDDVRNGYVSPESARNDYGVVIDTDLWEIDEPVTEELRRRMMG